VENLKKLEKEVRIDIAKVSSIDDLADKKVKILGRKGRLTIVLKGLKDMSEKDRRTFGKQANLLKNALEDLFDTRLTELRAVQREGALKKEAVDVTQPGRRMPKGHLHILTHAMREMNEIFRGIGFSVVNGPEIETEWFNFDALNIPPNHPARDMWDTFWLRQNQRPDTRGRKLLLRTHTSPVQIRYMQKNQPPFRIVVPGKVFRYEATDASHDIEFHQLEGLLVDKGISVAHLKHVIAHFFQTFFAYRAKKIEISLRPSFFPFTEPSFEVWMSCVHCLKKGCAVCRQSGWLEVAGAGMVHPNVFKNAGFNPANLQGFAFGFGVERLVMMKYKIPDIRLFHSSDPRFLKQF